MIAHGLLLFLQYLHNAFEVFLTKVVLPEALSPAIDKRKVESFSIIARRAILKIKPSDGSQEINYTAHYKETTSPQVTPTTPVKPVVV